MALVKRSYLMNHLVVVIFSGDVDRAASYAVELRNHPVSDKIDPARFVVAERDASGETHLQYRHFLTRDGAFVGGAWGILIGVLFLNPLIGAAAGAGIGAAAGELGDFGIGKPFVRELASHLKPGSSALFMPVDEAFVDIVTDALAPSGGVVMHTALTHKDESEMEAALDRIVSRNGQS